MPAVACKEKKKIKVWSAGCAGGEEVYSFRILWEEWRRDEDLVSGLEMWATDLNPEMIRRAQKGIYSFSSLKEIPEEWPSRYFGLAKENRWAIAQFLKEGIHWEVHNLLTDDPPAKGFQIIFLRNNLLTYYKDQLVRSGLEKVRESLSPGGFLIIGAHEILPGTVTELTPFPSHPNIFQNRLLFPYHERRRFPSSSSS